MAIQSRIASHVRRCDLNSLVRGFISGALGGLAGAYAMNQLPSEQQADPQPLSDEDATVKTAKQISRTFFNKELTPQEKQWAGPAVHYGFGALMGAAYGVLAESSPPASIGFGTTLGTALWFAADEIAVPAFGLSGPASAYPPAVHMRALASHLVYGIVTDLTRRASRRAFGACE